MCILATLNDRMVSALGIRVCKLALQMGLKPQLVLGAFAKLRDTTVSFVMSVRQYVCLSVRMDHLGFQWTDFHEI